MSSYIIGIIRVSRVRTPDRALENRCFCRHWSCGECRDRDEAKRNRGALLIAAVLTCLHKFLYLSRDDLHQPLPGFDRCPGDVRCDEKPVLIFYI